MSSANRRHVFISHHHADDAAVGRLTSLVARNGYDIRNSSIRVTRPPNIERLRNGQIRDSVLRRALRMKISWAGTVVVLIGRETHARPWVDWEIRTANQQGKRIVGVYERGGTEADLPPALEKYASAIVAWNSDKIMEAIDGTDNPFETPNGTTRNATHTLVATTC